MRSFLFSLAAAVRQALRFIWNPIRRGFELVCEAVPAAADAVETVASTVLSVPGNIVRNILGQHREPASEQQAAAKAASNATAAQAQVADVRDTADYGLSLRSACRRLAKGHDLAPSLMERLGSETVTYLSTLTRSELRTLAQEPPALVLGHVQGQRQAEGVRSVREVALALDAMRGVVTEGAKAEIVELAPDAAPAPRLTA